MTQMTVDQAYARKLANSILSEFGLERAQEYALRMMGSVCSETLRKRWSEVLQQINEIAHPLDSVRIFSRWCSPGERLRPPARPSRSLPEGRSGSRTWGQNAGSGSRRSTRGRCPRSWTGTGIWRGTGTPCRSPWIWPASTRTSDRTRSCSHTSSRRCLHDVGGDL